MGNVPEIAATSDSDRAAEAKVFISYSRKDDAFADRIEAALKTRGFTVAIDREEILAFEEWWKRIETLITGSDTVVFIISPDSISSKVALKEIDFATSLHKRFAPIVYRRVDGETVPEALRKYNFIFFDDEAQFEPRADQLAEALRTNIAWVRFHTEFGEATRQWSLANRPNGLLLRSPSLEQAERWIAERPEGAPAPTDETRTFIRLSRAAATRRRNILAASSVFGSVLVLGLTGLWYYQRVRANQALALSINNDLGFDPDSSFTPRQRNALWKLGVADESVKIDFMSIWTKSAENTERTSPAFPEIFRALGPLRPSRIEAESLATAVVRGLQANDSIVYSKSLIGQLQALLPKLSETQASQAIDSALKQIDRTTDSHTLRALPKSVQTLVPNLSIEQQNQTLISMLGRINETDDAFAIDALAHALQALSVRPTNLQANQALGTVLQRINAATVPEILKALVDALVVLPAAPTEPQANQVRDMVLGQIRQASDPRDLRVLADALLILPARLTDGQAHQAFDPVLQQIGEIAGAAWVHYQARDLAAALESLASKLTAPQANQELVSVVSQIGRTTDPETRRALVKTLGILASKLTDAQLNPELEQILRQIDQTNDPSLLVVPAETLEALGPRLTEAQAQRAADSVLRHIDQPTRYDALSKLAEALRALAPNLTEEKANEALEPVMRRIGEEEDEGSAAALALALRALASKLTNEKANDALHQVVWQIGQLRGVDAINDVVDAIPALAAAVQALAPKLTEENAREALKALLEKIGKTEYPGVVYSLASAIEALSVKLTEEEAKNAVEPILRQIGRTTDPVALRYLARALQVLRRS